MKHFTDWPQQTRAPQTVAVRKWRKDKSRRATCGLNGTSSCLSLSTQTPRACLNTFRGEPIHQLYVYVMALIFLFLQTWGDFFKANPAMFRVAASPPAVCLRLSPDVSWYEDICLVKALKALKLLIRAHTRLFTDDRRDTEAH